MEIQKKTPHFCVEKEEEEKNPKDECRILLGTVAIHPKERNSSPKTPIGGGSFAKCST